LALRYIHLHMTARAMSTAERALSRHQCKPIADVAEVCSSSSVARQTRRHCAAPLKSPRSMS
jgi:hypothetical protein